MCGASGDRVSKRDIHGLFAQAGRDISSYPYAECQAYRLVPGLVLSVKVRARHSSSGLQDVALLTVGAGAPAEEREQH